MAQEFVFQLAAKFVFQRIKGFVFRGQESCLQTVKWKEIILKVLMTGFDPFGGEDINPAFEAVKKMKDNIAGATLYKMELPTVFGKATEVLDETIAHIKPDLVVCVGQAGGRFQVTVERVAINLADTRRADNEGNCPVDCPVCKGGPAAYFSNLPVKAMVEGIRKIGIPAELSLSAGAFVCNAVFYSLMDLIYHKYPSIQGGFIHVPYSVEQVVGKSANTPSMALEIMTNALEIAVRVAVRDAEKAAESEEEKTEEEEEKDEYT